LAKGVPQGLNELPVGEQPLKMLKPHPFRAAYAVLGPVVLERHQPAPKRHIGKDDEPAEEREAHQHQDLLLIKQRQRDLFLVYVVLFYNLIHRFTPPVIFNYSIPYQFSQVYIVLLQVFCYNRTKKN
jgi:hypothetical protein